MQRQIKERQAERARKKAALVIKTNASELLPNTGVLGKRKEGEDKLMLLNNPLN